MENLGELEYQLLLALLHLESESYAVPLVQTLEDKIGRRVSPTGAYTVLRRLEKRGFVTSRVGPPTAERGGRPKRMFRLTPRALPAIRKTRSELNTLWQGLEEFLEDA